LIVIEALKIEADEEISRRQFIWSAKGLPNVCMNKTLTLKY